MRAERTSGTMRAVRTEGANRAERGMGAMSVGMMMMVARSSLGTREVIAAGLISGRGGIGLRVEVRGGEAINVHRLDAERVGTRMDNGGRHVIDAIEIKAWFLLAATRLGGHVSAVVLHHVVLTREARGAAGIEAGEVLLAGMDAVVTCKMATIFQYILLVVC